MPYVSSEQTKLIRNALKEAFPKNTKFSVSKDNGSLKVAIMQHDKDLLAGEDEHYTKVQKMPINHYHYKEHHNKHLAALVEKVLKVIDSTMPRKTLYVDGDYGNIPNYYLDLSVGNYTKPFVVKG